MWFFRVAVAWGLRLKSSLIWVAGRLKEPSSWASLAAMLTFAGFNVDVESCEGVIGFCVDKETWRAAIGMGVGVSGFLAVVLREKPAVVQEPLTDNNVAQPERPHPSNSDLERVKQPFPKPKRR